MLSSIGLSSIPVFMETIPSSSSLTNFPNPAMNSLCCCGDAEPQSLCWDKTGWYTNLSPERNLGDFWQFWIKIVLHFEVQFQHMISTRTHTQRHKETHRNKHTHRDTKRHTETHTTHTHIFENSFAYSFNTHISSAILADAFQAQTSTRTFQQEVSTLTFWRSFYTQTQHTHTQHQFTHTHISTYNFNTHISSPLSIHTHFNQKISTSQNIDRPFKNKKKNIRIENISGHFTHHQIYVTRFRQVHWDGLSGFQVPLGVLVEEDGPFFQSFVFCNRYHDLLFVSVLNRFLVRDNVRLLVHDVQPFLHLSRVACFTF